VTERRAKYLVKDSSDLESVLEQWIRHGTSLPIPDRQYRVKFPGMRQPYRLDFAWPSFKLAAEVQGGTWANGGHTRGSGYEHDRRRQNRLQLAGWTVLEFTRNMIESGEAVAMITEFFEKAKRGEM